MSCGSYVVGNNDRWNWAAAQLNLTII
jgi:hypothetical protein